MVGQTLWFTDFNSKGCQICYLFFCPSVFQKLHFQTISVVQCFQSKCTSFVCDELRLSESDNHSSKDPSVDICPIVLHKRCTIVCAVTSKVQKSDILSWHCQLQRKVLELSHLDVLRETEFWKWKWNGYL